MRTEEEVRERRKQFFDFMITRKKEHHLDNLMILPIIAHLDWVLGAEDDTKIMLALYEEVEKAVIK